MIKKTTEREEAIRLRRQGKTYAEILEVIFVAKSTLSIWFKEVGIAKSQKQKFSLIKKLAGQRGGDARRKQRIDTQKLIRRAARSDIRHITQRELFLIGIILYWAEGSKEKEYQPGSTFAFSNMDPYMIQIVLVWLRKVCKIKKNMIVFNIFLHSTYKPRVEEVKKYWAHVTGFPVSCFETVYWKNNSIKPTKRKNTGDTYHGVLKIKVKSSSGLVRQIAGWSEGVFENIIRK